jgi:integrase
VLYGCGLRINEVLSLKIKDFNTESGVLTILHSKNDTSRLVVMSGTLKKICAEYKELNLAGCGPDEYFFPNKIGGKRSSGQVSTYFKEILWKAGITYSGRGKGPRVHDIRHSFCCHAFKRMADEGIDMYCSLPILSAYMGHSEIRATEKYLRLTMAIFPEITAKMNKYAVGIYPEVYHEKTH